MKLTKGDKTKLSIIEKSAILFAQNGYTAVTMKDVCVACGLSRGGLYRHFSSTKEIFVDILENHKEEQEHQLTEAFKQNIDAVKLFEYFLQSRKNAILDEKHNMALAIHEFSFAEPDQRDFIDRRFKSAVKILMQLLEYGQKKSAYRDFETEAVASHIVFMIDSLETCSKSMTISDQVIDNQFQILRGLVLT